MRLTADDGRGAIAGTVAVAAGLAVSELANGFAHLRVSPVEAVAESIIRLTPGSVVEFVIAHVGHNDKPLVIGLTLVSLAIIGAATGILAMRSQVAAELVFLVMGVVLILSVRSRLPAGPTRYLPAAIGVLVAMVVLWLLVDAAKDVAKDMAKDMAKDVAASSSPVRRTASPGAETSRRSFLRLSAVVGIAALSVAVLGRTLAHGRAQVEAARATLARRFGSVPSVPGVSVGVDGVATWVTPVSEFYRIDTALAVPLVVPDDWQLRIHGMVEKEITLDYEQLLARGVTHDWLTLCCVSNPVGGDLISNAYWAGVPIGPILAEAGVHPEADAVLSRSVDGWTAGTPLAALTDGRNALFAVAMNGQPLTPEHGFPVRMVVPGLYGYVSATKWVVDLEVTRFSDFAAYWTQRGWSPQGPVKTQSRIDVPRNGSSLAAGRVTLAGVAWAQHRGISKVEVQIDDGPWRRCRIAADPTVDCWRQWAYEWQATPGTHTVQVRATDRTGEPQTSKVAGVLPDGATGYDHISVTVH